jgi:site-specific DNA-adenine methylase
MSVYNKTANLRATPETIRKVTITPQENWEDVYEQIKDVSSVKIQGLFEEIIKFFSELLEKTILLLIDEYEYLFKYSFDTPEGFMRMRTLSTQSLDSGLRPFTFWIAGAVTWDYLCSITGSGELNVINSTETLTPLTKENFTAMWNAETELIKDNELKKNLIENLEFAYSNSGGVPYYGKHIGNYFIKEKKQPDFSILKSFFNEIDTSLLLEEKKY